ncbi:MAG: hypothetical protein NT105_10495 [Verrucomicrobia bacterium]|nr:hypothetical protein [Verrucomicrobiota bacterium]
MKSNTRLKITSLLPAIWLSASSLMPFAVEPESKAAAKLPDWATGWRVTGVIRQGSKTEASVEHRIGWKRFVREGNEWSPGVVVEQIDAEQRTVTLRRGEQMTVLRAGAAPEITKGTTDVSAPAASADAAKAPFKTSLRVRLASGETVVAGGWASGPGRRTLALGTPVIDAQSGQVTFSMQFIDAPEAVWDRLGLGKVQSDGRESSQSSTLAAGRLDAILNAARGESGVDMLSAPRIITRDGSAAQISIGQESNPAGMISVNITPKLTPDRSAVDLSLDAQLPTP